MKTRAGIRPVILCGGGGTRLWPLSTARAPKQFLALSGAETMLVETLRRVQGVDRFVSPLAIGSARHGAQLKALLPEADLLLEPVGRNSAPPIAAAALLNDPDTLLLVLPADHHIADVDAFHAAVDAGAPRAEAGKIVTFGIEPDHAATGYGYIEAEAGSGVRPARRFVEKPDLNTAEGYLAAGGFYWNAGIFLFKASTMLAAFKAHAPDMLAAVADALDGTTLNRARFKAVPADSIDYAIMERHDGIEVVPVSMGWSDLGGFEALHSLQSERTRNPIVTSGPVAAEGVTRAYVRSEGPRIGVADVDDIAVVATRNAVLVSRLSGAPNLKAAAAAAQDDASRSITPCRRKKLADWLWTIVLPQWARCAFDEPSGGCVEQLHLDGTPAPAVVRRGRVTARQLFTFARAKRLGWNEDGLADLMIDRTLAHLQGPARVPQGGWAHGFGPDGRMTDPRRDLYDHAFVALAGAELAWAGDERGDTLAADAFTLIDELFADQDHGGWCDRETGRGEKLANPHMHLLEASLNHFEATADPASFERIETLCALFERWMFAPETGAVHEVFKPDWHRSADNFVSPGHCYEWAFLLAEAERLTGRDTVSWSRRLTAFAEGTGLRDGLAMDVLDEVEGGYRLWPQLERLRALSALGLTHADLPAQFDTIWQRYLEPGPAHGWIDKLDHDLKPAVTAVPASMLYHLMTGLAPLAGPDFVSAD
jgi:mannose-1-phosphate guanylyltransferase/mannose-6-phosphate isomerase